MSPALPNRARIVIIGGGVIGSSIAYHLAHLGWRDVIHCIDPANLPSLRVAAKLDFREVAHTTWRELPTIVFRRPPRRR